MKPQFTIPRQTSITAALLLTAISAVAAEPFTSTTQQANRDISAPSVSVITSTTEDLAGAIHASSGEYTVEATEGDITAINHTLDVRGSSGVMVNGTGTKMTLSGGNITASGRIALIAYEGATLEINSSAGGEIRATGIMYEAVSASGSGSAAGSTVTINGNLIAEAQGDSATVSAQSGSSITLNGAKNTVIARNTGLHAAAESSLTISGQTFVSAGNMGIYATLGADITSRGRITVATTSSASDSYAICIGAASAGNTRSTVNLYGGADISAASGTAIYAINKGVFNGHSAQYNINGNIYASLDGEVNLDMAGKSTLAGATFFRFANYPTDSTGIINITLKGESLWNVTGNSQLTSLTLGQGSALQLAFNGASLTDIITATGTITLEAGSVVYLTGDLSALEGGTFDFFSGDIVNNGVKFIGFDGTDWVEYEYTQTPGTNTFAFSASTPTVIDEPGFIPEPATATLGLLGLASLLVRRRRA